MHSEMLSGFSLLLQLDSELEAMLSEVVSARIELPRHLKPAVPQQVRLFSLLDLTFRLRAA